MRITWLQNILLVIHGTLNVYLKWDQGLLGDGLSMLVPLQDGPHGERVGVRPLEDGLLALQGGFARGAESALEVVPPMSAKSAVHAVKPL